MRHRTTRLITATAFACMMAGPAMAQGGWGQGHGQGHGTQMMQIIDENSDGVISADEAAAWVESVFAAKDSDSNDELTM